MGWPAPPCLDWLRECRRDTVVRDLVAASIVTVMLIPQSLAYALLAGLPAEVGLYASMAPLVAYAAFGSSRVLAVGPAAVVSLMTATAIGDLAPPGSPALLGAALVLAVMSGLMLGAMGLLRLGFLAHFLSHPVVSGFITASGVLIAAGQLKVLLGIPAAGTTLPALLADLLPRLDQAHGLTVAVGLGSLAFLLGARWGLAPGLQRLGMDPRRADLLAKAAPVAAVVLGTGLSGGLGWSSAGLGVVGAIPQGLPTLTLPPLDLALWQSLAPAALLISIVGFVESISVGQTLAARRRQRIDPDRELIALGAANLAAGLSGGCPVTGGFARSVVNFDAGAQTPAAGVFTAVGLMLAALLLTPALRHLPQATLGATIVVAVLSLVDFGVLQRTWRYDKADFAAAAATLAGTLLTGVESGLALGVGLSLVLHVARSSRPHIAVVGQVPGTEHFRNVERHAVRTSATLLSLRVDESLYFANARALEDRVNAELADRPALRHLVLQCSAINAIDASALESLEAIEHRLREAGVALHLSEVKGPVMDRLRDSDLLRRLGGQVFLSHYQAVASLEPGSLVGPADARVPPAAPSATR